MVNILINFFKEKILIASGKDAYWLEEMAF